MLRVGTKSTRLPISDFYDSTEKLAIVTGRLGFGIIEQVTSSMRNSTLLLSLFFIISLLIIAFTALKKEESSPV